MKQKLLTLTLGLAVMFGSVSAQNRCGYDDWVNQRNNLKPGYKVALDNDTKELLDMAHNKSDERSEDFDGKIWTIQVVFHVLWRTAAENIDSSFFVKQINRMNLDFSAMNADHPQVRALFAPFASGDTRIRFELATTLPSGKSTPIERRQTSIQTFFSSTGLGDGMADNVKKYITGGLDPWDNTKYLNVWVCNFNPPSTTGGETIGYATPPPGMAPYWANDPSDLSLQGLVLTYKVIGDNLNGSFPQGRTMVHEVGHFLGLRHVWGDATPACGDDLLWDTPAASENLIDYGPNSANNNPCAGITKTVRKFRVLTIGTTVYQYPSTYSYVLDNDSGTTKTYKIVFNPVTFKNDTIWNKKVRIDLFDSIATGNTLPDADSTSYFFAYPAGYTNYWIDTTHVIGSSGQDSIVYDTTNTEIVVALDTLTNQTFTKVLVPNTCNWHVVNPVDFTDYGDLPDMYENYMFYSSEKCQITWSNEQRTLMQYALKYRRSGIAVVTVNGVDEKLLAGKLVFAPNPATESIKLNNVEAGSTYEIVNIAGSSVMSGRTDSNEISVSNLAEGVYSIKVQTRNQTLVNKLMITK